MKLRWMVVLAVLMAFIANLSLTSTVFAAAPAVPQLVSPANGAINQPTTVTVQWAQSNPGETYRVQISKNASFTTRIVDARVTNATGYTVFGLSKDTVYYWRVNASANRQTSAWSPVRSFRTTNEQALAGPVLVSPTNGATGVQSSPTFVWNAVTGAVSYDFQIATDPNFSFVVGQYYGYQNTSITLTGFKAAYADHFYWRVRAGNAAGAGAWSAVWEFWMVRP